VQSCYQVNNMAIMVADLILANPRIITDHVAEVKTGAEVLARKAKEAGLKPVLPVVTNFMRINCPDDTTGKLKRFGYAVRRLDGEIRVSLGPPDLMGRFGDALKETTRESTFTPFSVDMIEYCVTRQEWES
ncbi:hypothetical protein LCGC14_3015500, partial [marine sediment metagenome]